MGVEKWQKKFWRFFDPLKTASRRSRPKSNISFESPQAALHTKYLRSSGWRTYLFAVCYLRRQSTRKLISFDDDTGELCLKIYTALKDTLEGRLGFVDAKGSNAGQLKFNLSIDESRQQEIIDFVCKGYSRYRCCSECAKNKDDETEKYEDAKKNLRRQLSDSLKLLSGYQKLTESFFQINGLEIPKDSTLFFNRNLTSLATPFMKKIRQTLINICIFLKIPVGKLAVNKVDYEGGS